MSLQELNDLIDIINKFDKQMNKNINKQFDRFYIELNIIEVNEIYRNSHL